MGQRIILFLYLFTCIPALCQPFYPGPTRRWVTGYSDEIFGPAFGEFIINSQNQGPNIEPFASDSIGLTIDATAINDRNGNMVFYSNGLRVGDSHGHLVENGDSLSSSGNALWVASDAEFGTFHSQSHLIIPFPGDTSRFFFVHTTVYSGILGSVGSGMPLVLWYSILHTDQTGHLKMEKKNKVLIQDTLELGFLAANKHANGRDWWVIAKQHAKSRYYAFLFSPDSIFTYDYPFDPIDCTFGGNQPRFSPDGETFAYHSENCRLRIYDFDRCNGTMNNFRWVTNSPVAPSILQGGLSFSPSSRYLYVNSLFDLCQYDMQSPNIAQSRKLIYSYPTSSPIIDVVSGFPTWLFLHTPAPDGKIYISGTNGVTLLSVIFYPDTVWNEVNFLPFALNLPKIQAGTSPYWPNYQLGPLIGSGCDSLGGIITGISSPEIDFLKIFPHPAHTETRLSFAPLGSTGGTLKILNIHGQFIKGYKLAPWSSEFDLPCEELPSGIYYLNLHHDGKTYGKVLSIVH
jgi:hypothetical protein